MGLMLIDSTAGRKTTRIKIQYLAIAHGKCPVCKDDLFRHVVECLRCHTQHHLDCWRFAGECAVYGCAKIASEPVSKSVVPSKQDMIVPNVVALSILCIIVNSYVPGFGILCPLLIALLLILHAH